MSPEEVYLHRESTSSQLYRGISASLGFRKPVGKLLCTSSNFCLILISIKVLFTSANLLFFGGERGGDEKMAFFFWKSFFLIKNELSAVNKTYIDVGNGQKFEHLTLFLCILSLTWNSLEAFDTESLFSSLILMLLHLWIMVFFRFYEKWLFCSRTNVSFLVLTDDFLTI